MHINLIIDPYHILPFYSLIISFNQQHPNMLSHFLLSVGIFMLATSSSQVLVDAFTLSSTTISSRLGSTSKSTTDSSTTGTTTVKMVAVCDMVESPTLVKEDTHVFVTSSITIQERSSNYANKSSELNDESYEMWTLKLFNDESNTRSYICRCLVQDAHLFEEDSYRKMMQAHKHGEAIIGEYSQEHAEYYKEALTSSGLVCDIFPVEQ